MLDIPLCNANTAPQILLTDENALPLCAQAPDRFAGAIAADGAHCADWTARLSPLPVGLALDCPAEPDRDECEKPWTLTYISRCKKAFREALHDDAAFYYLRGAQTFSGLRAAVLALTDLCGRAVIAEIAVEDEEGRMADGTDVRAAMGVLQRIGVTTIVLAAPSRTLLAEALAVTAPYARLSIGVKADAALLAGEESLPNLEVVLPAEQGSEQELLRAIDGRHSWQVVPRDHDDFILAPDGTNAHFIDPTIDISDEIKCGHRLEEALIHAEDDAGALKLLLETEEDLVALEEFDYMIARPVCLCAESADLLEQGLRVYPGLALYDGTWEQPAEVVQYLERKYGLIRL